MIKTTSQKGLTKSIIISAALHGAVMAVLFSKPLQLQSRLFSSLGKTATVMQEEENIAIIKRSQALEEALSYLETPPVGTPPSSPSTHLKTFPQGSSLQEEIGDFQVPALSLVFPTFEEPPVPLLSSPSTPSSLEQPMVLEELPPIIALKPSLENPSISSLGEVDAFFEIPIPFLSKLSEDPASSDFIPAEEANRTFSLPSPEIPALEQLDALTPQLGAPSVCEAPPIPVPGVLADFSISPSSPHLITGIRTATTLGEYGLPSLDLKEWNDFFEVDVKTYPHEEGGFLFSLTLIPKVDLSEYRMKQHYIFMIDRSSSMEKHRYQTAKRAVSRAITSLRPGDLFNILILDGSITKLSDASLPFSKAHLQEAEDFLEKQLHVRRGTSSDVYTTLMKVLNSQIETEESVTAILISDGDASSKSSQQRNKINNWLEANRDRVTLYTATAGNGNNLSSLKMLSLASRGTLLYSDTHAAFPRKLAKLVMDLRYPLAKEISLSILSPKNPAVELLPPSYRLPTLFSDHPYVIMGLTPKLTDFTLLLEGKNKDQIFSIKKTISLTKAKQGSRLLLKQWTAEKAHVLFDQYLREGEKSLLQKADTELGYDTQNSRR